MVFEIFQSLLKALGTLSFVKHAFGPTNTSEEIQKLLSKAEGSIDKTAQLQQALARLEATLSRKETQKVTEKSLKSR